MAVAAKRLPTALSWQLVRKASSRLSWGIADQAMSSISNFIVNLYIARTLGAEQYGAFGLAYVTYAFMLNASRGLATDPLLVRYSATSVSIWKQAVSKCTGTAVLVGVAGGACVLAVGTAMSGNTKMAFIALGLTLPGLLLQDSWRYSFFALGRGSHAFINDTMWTVVLLPAMMLLRGHGHASIFWFVLAWGASGGVASLVGPFQARVIPRISGSFEWLSKHRDLGFRYLLEGTANSSSTQLRNYGIGFVLGLAAVGYVQAANTLMGPFMVVFYGMGLVVLPEAARVLRTSPRRLPVFCVAMSVGLALMGFIWGLVLLVALPRGLGELMLGKIWRPTYSLVIPATIGIMGGCVSSGAGTALHALGVARRSLRAMILSSGTYVALGIAGALIAGTVGSMWGTALAGWIGAVVFWSETRVALREYGPLHGERNDRAMPTSVSNTIKDSQKT